MKTLIILVLVSQVLSSCKSYQKITKTGDAVQGINNIEPGKKYLILFNTGNQIKIRVNQVDSVVYGKVIVVYGKVIAGKANYEKRSYRTNDNFKESLESLKRNIKKIEVQKFDPYLTSLFVIIPGAVILLGVVIKQNASF